VRRLRAAAGGAHGHRSVARAVRRGSRQSGSDHGCPRLRAAREILALLGRTQFDANEARAIEILPAVQTAIRESGRGNEVFERDLAAAFDDQARISLFDFRKIREDRAKWDELLNQLSSREAELTKKISDRARALLPASPAAAVTVRSRSPSAFPDGRTRSSSPPAASGSGHRPLARAGRLQASAPPEQIQHVSRMIATEAYARAWSE
jgi:hypothetical protein